MPSLDHSRSRSAPGGILFDQLPQVDPSVPEPIPDFVFDQSLPDDLYA